MTHIANAIHRLSRSLIQWTLYPTCLGLAVALAPAGNDVGKGSLYFLLLPVVVVGICLLAERVAPFDPGWNRPRGDVGTDVAYLLLNKPIVSLAVFYPTIYAIDLGNRIKVFPTHWNLYAQLALFALIIEFTSYWWHRFTHRNAYAWRTHVSHHNSSRVYSLNFYRSHPTFAIVGALTGSVALRALGAGLEVATMWYGLFTACGVLQHSNIDFKVGPLAYVFATPQAHRWHHSTRPEEALNFAATLMIWDLVFGTFVLRGREVPARIGVDEAAGYPENGYLRQLIATFAWRRYVKQRVSPKQAPSSAPQGLAPAPSPEA